MSKVIGADAAKLAGLQIDTLQKARDGQITLEHWEWFNKLTKTERDRLCRDGHVDTRSQARQTIEAVNKVVSSAQERWAAFDDLFDRQIQTLRDRGCPSQVLAMLISQKPQVLAKASTMTFKEGRIPFLSIIPFSALNLSTQMSMVRNGNQSGISCLDTNEIKDIVSTPVQPYFIFDVEDGEGMLGRSVLKATELIKSQNRSPLTAAEVISLGIQAKALSKRYVDAAGSRYRNDDRAPFLCLDVSRPGLGWNGVDSSFSECGSASCGSRS